MVMWDKYCQKICTLTLRPRHESFWLGCQGPPA